MKPYLLNVNRIEADKPGVTFEAVLITIERDKFRKNEDTMPKLKGMYIAGPLITEKKHLTNEQVKDFQKPDKTIDYDKITTYCWVELLNQIRLHLHNNYLNGKLQSGEQLGE